MKILVNQLGYEIGGSVRAVLQGLAGEILPDRVKLRDAEGRELAEISAGDECSVAGWKGRSFRVVEFPAPEGGPFFLEMSSDFGVVVSPQFCTGPMLEASRLVSNLLFGFTSGRSAGTSDKQDRSVPFFGDRNGTVDVHGGWYDASGDTSKYLSHLSYANFMNPQQTPLVVWTLLDSLDRLRNGDFPLEERLELRLGEEALFGADFLKRMQDSDGYFYMTVFDRWSKEMDARKICAYRTQDGILTEDYQAAYRQGGGMTIAALARSSCLSGPGAENTEAEDFLTAAVLGWKHLEVNNLEYLDNGTENIIDDTCALLAATELYAAGYEEAAEAASLRAESLMCRWNAEEGWFRADDKADWSWFHASDEALPLIALLRAAETGVLADKTSAKARHIAEEAIIVEIRRSASVDNPFIHPRHLVKMPGQAMREQFFYPHENPSGYWWQGENARLASWAAACRRYLSLQRGQEGDSISEIRRFADAQVSWILGMNPFDVCMMQGEGRNNPVYEWDHFNVPGGVANGITSGLDDEDDIAFIPENIAEGGDHAWRWGEQWIPHAAWLLLASSWAGLTEL